MAPPSILLIGKVGQVGWELRRTLAPMARVTCVDFPDIDLTRGDSIRQWVRETRPNIVINAAAYTAVDKAEAEPDLAMRVNGEGARAVAAAAARTGRPVVQVSTDYVFDGALDRPYCEDDPVGPLGVYGRSKLAGETAVAAANARHIIARTAWVYSPFGHNFLKTMLRLGLTRDEVGVVADQWGAPTSALDLADALIAMARRLVGEPVAWNAP